MDLHLNVNFLMYVVRLLLAYSSPSFYTDASFGAGSLVEAGEITQITAPKGGGVIIDSLR